MINLYLHSISSPLSNFEQQLAKLPAPIQNHILKRKRKSKQEISLSGYLLLQKALQKDFGRTLDQVTFLDSGKPVFEGEPIHFNISHSGNLVGVAISKKGLLGLDMEQFRKFKNIEAAFSFFSKVEQEAILLADFPEQKLIEFWSKKEAFIKALGGQMFDMAGNTDVRFLSTSWRNETYFFYPIEQNFDGFIWIASSFSTNNIVITQVENL